MREYVNKWGEVRMNNARKVMNEKVKESGQEKHSQSRSHLFTIGFFIGQYFVWMG